jgi:hypothetical protein
MKVCFRLSIGSHKCVDFSLSNLVAIRPGEVPLAPAFRALADKRALRASALCGRSFHRQFFCVSGLQALSQNTTSIMHKSIHKS